MIAQKKTRVKAKIEFPEMNTEGDVFRAGTLLEMVRTIATDLARNGKRVKLCVQGSMGTGVFQGLPLSLAGISRLIDLMDWEDDVVDKISNGAIGKEHAKDDEDVFILISPQNIVGYSVLPYMEEMMERVGPNRAMILLNPKLGDIQSAGNVMSIRGRAGRMEFEQSWEQIYHFRLLYRKPYFFPIYGALRKSCASMNSGEWELYKRFGKRDDEYYQLMKVYDKNKEPNPDELTKVIWGKMK